MCVCVDFPDLFLHVVATVNGLGQGLSILELGLRCLKTLSAPIQITKANANTS